MDKQIHTILLTDSHLKETNIEQNLKLYRESIKFAKSKNISTIYHLGDLIDSRKAQPLSVLSAFKDILQLFEEQDMTLFAIPGNHCKTNYSSVDSFLLPFKTHPSFILKETWYSFMPDDNTVFHFIPFFSDEKYRVELQKAVSETTILKKELKHILFTHIGFSGARMNSGLIVDGIKPSEVAMFDKVYVGHYHDKQNVGDNIHYIGASLQHNYGETPDKGLTIIYNDLTFETVEVPTKRYHKLEVDIEKLEASDIKEIIEVSQNSNDNYRVVLVGTEEKIKSFNRQQLQVAGISVETKIDKIEKTEIEDRVEAFTTLTLVSNFEKFCEIKKLDLEQGLGYLKQII